MTNVEHKNAILRWFEAVNQADLTLLDTLADEIFRVDFIAHDPRLLGFEPGPAGVKRFIRRVLAENKDVHVTVHDIFSEADKLAYRFTVSMTEVESGKAVDVQLLAIDHFIGDQIAEEWQLSAPGKW
jgi:hypothetical protein